MSKETWFCRKCGSTDIRHDAIVEYNPEKGDYEIVCVLDDTWCESCLTQDWNDNGDPAFGIPSEDEEDVSFPESTTAPQSGQAVNATDLFRRGR